MKNKTLKKYKSNEKLKIILKKQIIIIITIIVIISNEYVWWIKRYKIVQY